MRFEIKSWLTGNVIFSVEAGSLRLAVEAAVEQRVSLRDAVLSGANLSGAVLRDAVLRDADLRDAVLSGDQIVAFRDDVWAVLSAAPAEAEAVLLALREGRIDGSVYQGECACLVGTIANARHCTVNEIPALKPDSRRLAEVWFMQIKPGDTPDTNPAAKRAAEWVEQWIGNVRGAFAVGEGVDRG